MEPIAAPQEDIFAEEQRIIWRRRRRLILSKIPECLNKKIVKVTFCSRKRDFEEAFSLLYQRYHKVGLLPSLPEGIFFTPYQFLPSSRVCIARDYETKRVTSTGTLVIDSPLGLPSDCIYKDLIDKLRAQGRKLAEFSCLAAKPDIYSRNGLFYVFRMLYKYAVQKGITDIVISVHPKHTTFYELILLFERIGPKRYYSKLLDAPAYLERLDLTNVQEIYERAYLPFEEGKVVVDFFFHRAYPEDLTELAILKTATPELFRYFFFERTNKFQDLEEKFKNFFKHHYQIEAVENALFSWKAK